MVRISAKRLDRTDISASESGRRRNTANHFRVQELCESRGGRPGLPSLINSVSVDNERAFWFLWT